MEHKLTVNRFSNKFYVDEDELFRLLTFYAECAIPVEADIIRNVRNDIARAIEDAKGNK